MQAPNREAAGTFNLSAEQRSQLAVQEPRDNDAAEVLVVIMQRLHEEDISGVILRPRTTAARSPAPRPPPQDRADAGEILRMTAQQRNRPIVRSPQEKDGDPSRDGTAALKSQIEVDAYLIAPRFICADRDMCAWSHEQPSR